MLLTLRYGKVVFVVLNMRTVMFSMQLHPLQPLHEAHKVWNMKLLLWAKFQWNWQLSILYTAHIFLVPPCEWLTITVHNHLQSFYRFNHILPKFLTSRQEKEGRRKFFFVHFPSEFRTQCHIHACYTHRKDKILMQSSMSCWV